MKFCEKLQKLRKDNHLSQEDLADKLDVSRQAVSKWESATTYPEMDKLLTLCKLFNVTLDELTNDSISLDDVKKEKNNSITKELYYLIDKSFYMFKNMSAKKTFKTLFELIVLLLILLVFKIPLNYIYDIGSEVIYTIPKGASIIDGVYSFFINLVYFILLVLSFTYIYKTYYLDKFEIEIDKSETGKDSNELIKETKKIESNKENGFSDKVFIVLSKIFSVLIKGFTLLISLPFVICFLLLIVVLSVLVIYIFKGVTYFGAILIVFGSGIISGLLLLVLLSFVFNTRVNFKVMIIMFISSLGVIGVGSGLFGYEIAKTEFVNEVPNTKYEVTTDKYEYSNDVSFDNFRYYDDYDINYYGYSVNYEVDEELIDRVIIELSYYKEFVDYKLYSNDFGTYERVYLVKSIKSNKEILNLVISDLKNKKVFNYEKLYGVGVNIKGSKDTLDKIKNNRYNYNRGYIHEECDEDDVIISKNKKIEELESDNNKLKSEIDELKNKIKSLIE